MKNVKVSPHYLRVLLSLETGKVKNTYLTLEKADEVFFLTFSCFLPFLSPNIY
jgi:hypothetical protein